MQQITIGFHFKSSRAVKGAIAEQSLTEALNNEGYNAERCFHAGHDLIIRDANGCIIRIEVKFATRGKDGKYRATTIKKNATDHRKSDVIVMLCQLPEQGGKCEAFVIPTAFQGDKHHIVITSDPTTYSGCYAAFRNAWSNLNVQ